jgi:hypothetical protein
MKAAALFVSHRYNWKCVGRVYPTELEEIRYKGIVFEHVHTESQRHFDTRGPGGFDLEVIGFLMSRGITLILDCEQGERHRTWSYITLEHLLAIGQRATQDGRTRIFVAYKDLRVVSKRFKRPPPNLPEVKLYAHEAEPAMDWFAKKVQQGHLFEGDPVDGKLNSAGI